MLRGSFGHRRTSIADAVFLSQATQLRTQRGFQGLHGTPLLVLVATENLYEKFKTCQVSAGFGNQ